MSSSTKNKHDETLYALARSGSFRVSVEGRIETNRRWNGHRDVLVDWFVCDRSDGKGYLYVSWHMVRVKAHRLAYCLYHPDEDITGWEINHLDGVRTNNRESNLERCNAVRQSKHAFDTGLNPARGEAHCNARLTESIVREIRALRQLGVPYTQMARRFGVTPAAIRFACIRHTWKHII